MASSHVRMPSDMSEHPENRLRSALRLLGAEGSEDLFPVLLEEIVALGYARTLVTRVNFETSEIAPMASLNCPKAFIQRFQTPLGAIENPLARALHTGEPELVRGQANAAPICITTRFFIATRLPVGKPTAHGGAIALLSGTFTGNAGCNYRNRLAPSAPRGPTPPSL